MIPVTYKMIDLNGLDLAEINGEEVPGIYNKIASAYNTSRFAIMCNWLFAGLVIAPAHVLISQIENGFLLNDIISVKSDDTVSVVGIIPEPMLEPLEVTENGIYTPPSGVDGFNPVEVQISVPTPYDSVPEMDGQGSSGDSSSWARGNHVHPSDTVLLWTNPNPNSDFAAQTIPLDLNGYESIKVFVNGCPAFEIGINDGLGAIGLNGWTNSSGALGIRTRNYQFVSTGIHFDDCIQINIQTYSSSASGSPAIRNDLNKPLRIYGIK